MADVISTDKVSSPLTLTAMPPWLLALVAAALYPTLLSLFPLAIQNFTGAGNPFLQSLWACAAIAVMALALGVSLLAFWALMKTPVEATPKAIAIRRVLHVVFAVHPLYGFTRLVAGRVGLIEWYGVLWLAVVAATALLIARANDTSIRPAAVSPTATMLRRVHGITALLLFVGFLFVHVLNHAVALWSVALQETWMTALRLWYRAPWVEPLLLGAFGLMMLTGVPMMLRNTRTGGNLWRTLQSVAGVYIVVFLFSHVTAVLTARADGRDTDWIFATGQNGLIAGSSSLIPYYILSIAMLFIHVALGVRMRMLRRSADTLQVNRTFSALMWFAGISTLWVTAAILGVQLAA